MPLSRQDTKLSPATLIDVELFERIANGDRSAFRQLFSIHKQNLFRFLLRIVGDREGAEELVNDTMLSVWRHAAEFHGASAPKTWIFSIAYHRAATWLKKRKTSLSRLSSIDNASVEAIADAADSSETSAHKSQLSDTFRTLMAELDEHHRAVLHLAYYQDLTVSEIAKVMDCAEGTVKSRMFHARLRLRTMLEAAGIDERST